MSSDTCQYIPNKGSDAGKICGKDLSTDSITKKYCNKHVFNEFKAYTVWNFTLKCNNGYVLVLREILIHFSPVFKAALEENKDDIIDIDYPAYLVYCVMRSLHDRIIYSSEIDIPSSPQTIESMCKFIHQYDIKEMNDALGYNIEKYIEDDNENIESITNFIYSWMLVSHTYKMNLPETLARYIVRNNVVDEWMEQDRKNSYKLMMYHKNIINVLTKKE